MKVSARDYRLAAGERLQSAVTLYREDHFVECIYVSGLAVECLLRGVVEHSSLEFDARHDLPRLLKSAAPAFGRQYAEVASSVHDLWARWKNNYRYVPGSRLRTQLFRLGLHHRVRGDILKENARVAVAHALFVVNRGKGT